MKKRKSTEYFARIFERMMRTEAWQDLSGTEAKLYLEMVRRYRGNNNGAIVFGRRDAERCLGVGPHKAHAAFGGLQRRGFIAPVVKGAFSRKLKATEWRLTEYDCNVTGEAATNDFLHWTPESGPKIQNAGAKTAPSRCQNSTYAGAKTAPMAKNPRVRDQGVSRSIGAKTAPLSRSAIHLLCQGGSHSEAERKLVDADEVWRMYEEELNRNRKGKLT